MLTTRTSTVAAGNPPGSPRSTAAAEPASAGRLALAERHSRAGLPGGIKPLLATIPTPLPAPDGVVYGMGRVDSSGRVTDRTLLLALGWCPGDRLTPTGTSGEVAPTWTQRAWSPSRPDVPHHPRQPAPPLRIPAGRPSATRRPTRRQPAGQTTATAGRRTCGGTRSAWCPGDAGSGHAGSTRCQNRNAPRSPPRTGRRPPTGSAPDPPASPVPTASG